MGKTVRELEHGPDWDRGLGVREQTWWMKLAELEAGGPQEERRRRAIKAMEAKLEEE